MSSIFSHLLQLFHMDGQSEGSSGGSPIENWLEGVSDFFRRLADHFFHAHHDCPPNQSSGGSEDADNPTAPSGGDGHCSAPSNNSGPGDGAGGTDDGNHAHGWWLATDWTNPDCPPLCNPPNPSGTDGNHSGDEQASSQFEPDAVHSDQRLGSNLTQLVQAMASHFVNNAGFDPGSNSHIAANSASETTLAAVWHG
jgi:hypothetical protein